MNTLHKLMKVIEDQLSLRGFEYDCGCPWCEVLKPLAYALNEAKAEVEAEDYRVFCAEAQVKGEAQERARQVVESGGTLAQARYLRGGRIELWMGGVHIQTFDSAWRFFVYCELHTLTIKVKTEK
jgi:hypothetical protein